MAFDAKPAPLRIAVIGAGISGLSAAWLLGRRHRVTLYEAEGRLGGHSNTADVTVGGVPVAVDTGFIVYNEENYPNLTAMFDHLGVQTSSTDMSFGVSLDGGRFEYSSLGVGMLAQPGNLANPRFWAMLRDVRRFYRDGAGHEAAFEEPLIDIGEYLQRQGFCRAFQEDHLLPQAAAIWSASVADIRRYPAAAMIRFFKNHGLMKIVGRPLWRTVRGGSRVYVQKLREGFAGEVRCGAPVVGVRRTGAGAEVRDASGHVERYDQVVLACHADQALALLEDPTPEERNTLSAFRYSKNVAVLHTDRALMPKRRLAWAAWNHLGRRDAPDEGAVTYWMNILQPLPTKTPLFVSINPHLQPRPETVLRTEAYDHPLFDGEAMAAQARLWDLQGRRGVWFCGAYFGAGFHEDGLQAGLAVAEALGGVRRPWTVENESGRIPLPSTPALAA